MELVVRSVVVAALAVAVPAAVVVYGMVDRPPSAKAPAYGATASSATPGGAPMPMGSSSCAAAACHGGSPALSLTSPPGPTCWQTSATHWLAADPHTKAFAVLTDDGPAREKDLAKRIMIHLTGRKENGRPNVEATEYDRCLACHTNPYLVSGNADKVGNRMAGLRAEGVGCEACHGNASNWYGPHTTWNPGTRAAEYPPHGMVKLYDLGERALACAGCHVGAPADPERGYPVPRDMNHDMIAAGHPRLNFDFADYQRRLPPHWQEKSRLSASQAPRGPEFEIKGWLVGRVAVAEAACRLTADREVRAARGESLSPWPEFAEFNCYACHHELLPADWRQATKGYYGTRPPGAAPWQTIWPVTRPTADLMRLGEVAELLDAMEARGKRPVRGPADAATRAADALAKLRVGFAGMPDGYAARSGAQVFAGLKDQAAVLDWDTAAQAYMGAVTYQRARLAQVPGTVMNPAFGPAFDRLKFPHKDDKTGETFNSPHGLDPATIRKDLGGVLQSVEWPPK